jgi:hypothetical protein
VSEDSKVCERSIAGRRVRRGNPPAQQLNDETSYVRGSGGRVTRFLNRFLLPNRSTMHYVINSVLLTAKCDSLLGICRLRLGFSHVYDNG